MFFVMSLLSRRSTRPNLCHNRQLFGHMWQVVNMNVEQFLDLKVNEDSRTASMTAAARNCTALGFLYGGAGLASAVESLEQITERPVIWASCQFNNFARTDAEILLKIEESVRGRNVSHANVDARVNGDPVSKTLATLGHRDVDTHTQWLEMPQLDKPEECPRFGIGKVKGDKECIDNRIEFRVARGSLRKDKQVEGQMALWARIPELDKISTASIALMADYLPVSAGSMLKRPAGGNSLDNSLRVLRIEQSEWLLCDCEVRGIQNGFGHATMNIWSETGMLMAVASQSFIFREFSFKKQ